MRYTSWGRLTLGPSTRSGDRASSLSSRLNRVAALTLTLVTAGAILVSPLAQAAPEPARPVALPAATTSPNASPSPGVDPSPGETPSASPSPSPSVRPKVKPADEDQWVFLAIAVGGGLIGAVLLFMIAGGLLRRVTTKKR